MPPPPPPHTQLWYEEYSREYLKHIKVIDYNKGTPNSHLSITFECNHGIIGRVTPEMTGSLYVLDFVWPDGTRVEDARILGVWDVCGGGGVRILTAGAGCDTQIYFINTYRKYEVRSLQDGRVIKTVSFPPVLRLE